MYTDQYDTPVYQYDDIVNLIYNEQVDDIFKVYVENSSNIDKFNNIQRIVQQNTLKVYNPIPYDDLAQTMLDAEMQQEWYMPDEFKEIDVQEFCLLKCKNEIETNRVIAEMSEYHSRGLTNVLRFMIFLVSYMKEHNIVWGVGRGSSVASYVLYLIGVHKVNSIVYNLDFNEFMK